MKGQRGRTEWGQLNSDLTCRYKIRVTTTLLLFRLVIHGQLEPFQPHVIKTCCQIILLLVCISPSKHFKGTNHPKSSYSSALATNSSSQQRIKENTANWKQASGNESNWGQKGPSWGNVAWLTHNLLLSPSQVSLSLSVLSRISFNKSFFPYSLNSQTLWSLTKYVILFCRVFKLTTVMKPSTKSKLFTKSQALQ